MQNLPPKMFPKYIERKAKISASLGGLEPPTFRLTAERANQLRHRDHYNDNSQQIYA